MIGFAFTYLALGLYFWLMFEAEYRRLVRPGVAQRAAFLGLVVAAWPWMWWMMIRGKR